MSKSRSAARFSLLRAALFVALWLFVSAPAVTFGAEAQKGKNREALQFNKNDPIIITSDRMEADRKKNFVIYSGRVVAVQGEMTMKSNTLTAHFNPDMKGFKEIIAEGNVHITQLDRVATGTKAVFNDQQKTITLTGNAMVRQGNSEVSGPRIIFFIEEDRAIAESSGQQNQRVKATIFPSELQQKRDEPQPVKQP
jgi:lipopolysaccharide export system protein LptA